MSASLLKKEPKEGVEPAKDEDTDTEGSSLNLDFQKILDLYEEVQNSAIATNEPEFQKKIRDGIARLEQMTRTVNVLSLFSPNEAIEEVSTENLKFFLLPAFLADFSTRNQQFDRLDMLDHAEVYYKDYIQRLNEYGVCDIDLKKGKDDDKEKDDTAKEVEVGHIKKDPLVASAVFRESKINRYREAQRLEQQLLQLKRLIIEQENQGHVIDYEVERKFYLTLITQWLARAVDELAAIDMEKPMAQMRKAMLENNATDSGASGPDHSHRKPEKPKPLQPIIITRDATQKKIYGLGYPSIPTVTVDEFINQKVSDGSLAFNDKRVYGNSLYDWADNPDKKRQGDEDEEERKERLEEEDDEVELARKRSWDDWKDDHKRGEGNRHNMG